MGTIFYLSSEKNEFLSCRDLAIDKIGNREDFEEMFIEDFGSVDLFKSFDENLDIELFEGNEYFDIKKVDGVFEMKLKDCAIERALNIYVNTLEDYAEHIKTYKTRGFASVYGVNANSSLIRFNEVYRHNNCNRFMSLDVYEEDVFRDGPKYVIEPEDVFDIYQLLDMAIDQGITKWYLLPIIGCYR